MRAACIRHGTRARAVRLAVSFVLVVPATLNIKTLDEFVAYAKARPDQLSYAGSAVGTTVHLSTEINQSMGVDPVKPHKPEAFEANRKSEIERWTRIIKEANIKAD